METIHKKTSRKTQVTMERRYQGGLEQDETYKMGRTSPGSFKIKGNCSEGQDSTTVVTP